MASWLQAVGERRWFRQRNNGSRQYAACDPPGCEPSSRGKERQTLPWNSPAVRAGQEFRRSFRALQIGVCGVIPLPKKKSPSSYKAMSAIDRLAGDNRSSTLFGEWPRLRVPFGGIRLLLESNELCHVFVKLGDSSKEKQNLKENRLDIPQAKECQERGEHAQREYIETMAPAGKCMCLDCWWLHVCVRLCVSLVNCALTTCLVKASFQNWS